VDTGWIVVKFGGTSVTGRENWERILSVLKMRLVEGKRILVVCSALSKVSDTLERLAQKAASGQKSASLLSGVHERHLMQARDLGVSIDVIGDLLSDLEKLTQGASLIQEVSPKLWARILSAGELMSTKLGAHWLSEQGVSTHWLDARTVLRTQGVQTKADYLSARAEYDFDEDLLHQLDALDEDIVVTQGFIGQNRLGETVLLGRGGSDTSAACFASKIGAERLEIWTDVPGMFSANPKEISNARLLKSLDYDEAQELATSGAKALHPRAIPPVRKAGIPLYIYSTMAPSISGTVIEAVAQGRAGIKGISARKGIALISMETMGMWQQAGFLADVFTVFKKHGVSIDMIATAESNVTVSLDVGTHTFESIELAQLLVDLKEFCIPKLISPVASVSLVGRNIRAILHQLGPIFERFSDHRVHMLTQSASDLNLTVVVDEEQADTLVQTLHEKLFSKELVDPSFGPTWANLFEPPRPKTPSWWVSKRERLMEEIQETPSFVYDEEVLMERANELLAIQAVERVFFATKANPHPEILRLFYQLGLGFECVSPQEIAHVRTVIPDISMDRILFTPNFAPRSEYEDGVVLGCHLTLDSIFPLRMWPEIFLGKRLIIRIDTGKGKGHHKYVVTAGSQSKFGIPPQDLDELVELVKKYDIDVVGLHAHAGSGIRDANNWAERAEYLQSLRLRFPSVRVLNLGGGFGVPERPSQERLDIEKVQGSLLTFKTMHPDLSLWIEPGRYLVAEAGILLARVTQLKSKGERVYVGTDAGMNSLIRPALYGAYHHIENMTKWGDVRSIVADVVGPICESGDVLGRGRVLPATESGDVLVVETAGAYGHSMSSEYNLRKPAQEIWLPKKCV
jgi:diaminopimelate decarboxylase/aspartate kinase